MKLTNLSNMTVLAIALSGTSAAALADDGFSYNYLDAAYLDTEIDADGFDIDGDGFGLNGSVELGSNLFLTAGYATREFEDSVDLDQWSVGLGAHAPLSDNLDIVGRVSYVDAELDSILGSIDTDGYGVGIGLRARIADSFELEGGVNYIDLDEAGDDTSLSLTGRYYLTEQFALFAGADVAEDTTSWSAGVRFQF